MITGVTLRAHMDAALRETFLDHGGNIHEGLHHDPRDPFAQEPAQPLLLARELAGGQRGEGTNTKVALRADVLPKIHRPRRSLAGQPRRVRQSNDKGRTSELIFSVPALVQGLSETATLLPGDIIFTGTPSGVGLGRSPQRFIQPGETLISRIEGIGEIQQTFVAAGS